MSLQLFKKLFDENNIYMADVVIKNMLNKSKGDTEIFNEFFEFKCRLASWDIDIHTRQASLQEAQAALIVYSENTDLDEDTIRSIESYYNRISEIQGDIEDVQSVIIEKEMQKAEQLNRKILDKLVELQSYIMKITDKDKFYKRLQEVQTLENSLNENYLDESSKTLYYNLTDQYSELVNEKIEKFNWEEDRDYNLKVTNDIKYVYEQFKGDEGKYKNTFSNLKRLLENHFLNFDQSRLFGETQIYFNQVYTYIFNKLSEDGKFELTQLAISTEKCG